VTTPIAKRFLDFSSDSQEKPNLSKVSKKRKVKQEKKPIPVSEHINLIIDSWDPAKAQEISSLAFKHLEIGAANYEPTLSPLIDDSSPKKYVHLPSDPLGEKIHRVLFASIDHLIDTHPDQSDFIFYLNDITSEGLDIAAKNLAHHLKEKYTHKKITIQIEKIAADIFEIDHLPNVDSAALLHPEDSIIPYVFTTPCRIKERCSPPCIDVQKAKEAQKTYSHFLHKIAAISKTGLVIKECNSAAATVVKITKELIANSPVENGLQFKPVDTSYIPDYLFPSGELLNSTDLSYRVVRAPHS
jgi:hypothetical protein